MKDRHYFNKKIKSGIFILIYVKKISNGKYCETKGKDYIFNI